MEKQRPDISPMPEFHLLRINPLEIAAHGLIRTLKAVRSFITDRHSVPYSEHSKADEMLLGEPDLRQVADGYSSEQMMLDYWGEFVEEQDGIS